MRYFAGLLFTVAIAFAVDNAWTKVSELKTGTELRIYKGAAKAPILATLDEANEERIVVVIKNEQVAIPKSEIDRIDYRPKGRPRVTKENRTTVTDSNPAGVPRSQTTGPNTSVSSGISIGKAEFETIYLRHRLSEKGVL